VSLGEPRPSIFRGKGCLITGLIGLVAVIGIWYYQGHQARKRFWEDMDRLAGEMVDYSGLAADKKQQARQILTEMVAKGRDDVLSTEDQKRIIVEMFLGSPCRLFMVLRRTEPAEMTADLRARWDRALSAFLLAVEQKPPTKEESEALDKAAPPQDEYTKDHRMKVAHLDKILTAFDAFFKGRGLDPATAPPFDYDRKLRQTMRRIAVALGHDDFWPDAATTQAVTTRAVATQAATTQAVATQAVATQGAATRSRK